MQVSLFLFPFNRSENELRDKDRCYMITATPFPYQHSFQAKLKL
jgi:hypothetical protein